MQKDFFRIGFGYDVHALAENRKLILGGVEIPSGKGLLGHSDADMLLHAIADAMLGALSLGDIGKHFPDTELKYKDIDSKILLGEVNRIINNSGYQIGNVDSTVVLEQPKIAPYIIQMRTTIAGVLNTEIERISVKATTSERLGFAGRGEGAEAFAVVMLIKDAG